MRGNTIPITIVLALTFAMLPLGTADWGSRGSLEPDTSYDRNSGYMFVDPDTSGSSARKVYFNAWAGAGGALLNTANPNSAAADTTVLMAPHRPMAVLGIWKDCNKDGYMGMSENALYDYPSALLGDTSICPPTPGDNLAHNDGEMVRELIPIGPDPNFGEESDANVHNFPDDTVMWVDFKLPGDSADPSCPLTPVPAGTLDTTGGFLRYVDCIDNWRVTGTWNTVAHLAGLDEYAFDDAPKEQPGQSSSPLNRGNPYGQDEDARIVSAFDCSAEPMRHHDDTGATRQNILITDPTGGELGAVFGPDGETRVYLNLTDQDYNVNISGQPRGVPTVNPDGSLAGTVNETESSLGGDCNTTEEKNCGGSNSLTGAIFLGRDQHTNGDIYCWSQAEGNRLVAPTGRSEVNNRMFFSESDAVGAAGAIIQDPTVFLGLPTRLEGFWVGQTSYLASRNPLVNIDTFLPKEVSYFTHYVQLGANATSQLTLPTSTLGIYGHEWCSRSQDPAENGGFVCDPDAWIADANGNGNLEDEPKAGWAYHLRDIDCYDTSASGARDAGVHWGVVTGTACSR